MLEGLGDSPDNLFRFLRDLIPDESECAPSSQLCGIVPLAIQFERIQKSVPTAAIALDHELVPWIRQVDSAIGRCQPRWLELERGRRQLRISDQLNEPSLQLGLGRPIPGPTLGENCAQLSRARLSASSELSEERNEEVEVQQSSGQAVVDDSFEASFSQDGSEVNDSPFGCRYRQSVSDDDMCVGEVS